MSKRDVRLDRQLEQLFRVFPDCEIYLNPADEFRRPGRSTWGVHCRATRDWRIAEEEPPVRKLVVTNVMSVDGFVDGDNSPEPRLPISSEVEAETFNAYNAERLRSASTLLAGRVSFEMFEGYWPAIEGDETIDATQREISRLNNRADKLVVSDSYEVPASSPWAASTRVVNRDDATDTVRALKEEHGEDILVFGSSTTWNALLDAGLVDELHLMVTPVALGGGVPAFKHGRERELKLLDTTTFEGSSTVVLRYAPRYDR